MLVDIRRAQDIMRTAVEIALSGDRFDIGKHAGQHTSNMDSARYAVVAAAQELERIGDWQSDDWTARALEAKYGSTFRLVPWITTPIGGTV